MVLCASCTVRLSIEQHQDSQLRPACREWSFIAGEEASKCLPKCSLQGPLVRRSRRDPASMGARRVCSWGPKGSSFHGRVYSFFCIVPETQRYPAQVQNPAVLRLNDASEASDEFTSSPSVINIRSREHARPGSLGPSKTKLFLGQVSTR